MKGKLLAVALVLGLLTSVVIGLAEAYLPKSAAKGAVIDALALPGAAIASLHYTEGLHTGRGAPSWALAVITLNFIVYVLFWILLLALIKRFGHRGRWPNSGASVRRGGM